MCTNVTWPGISSISATAPSPPILSFLARPVISPHNQICRISCRSVVRFLFDGRLKVACSHRRAKSSIHFACRARTWLVYRHTRRCKSLHLQCPSTDRFLLKSEILGLDKQNSKSSLDRITLCRWPWQGVTWKCRYAGLVSLGTYTAIYLAGKLGDKSNMCWSRLRTTVYLVIFHRVGRDCNIKTKQRVVIKNDGPHHCKLD